MSRRGCLEYEGALGKNVEAREESSVQCYTLHKGKLSDRTYLKVPLSYCRARRKVYEVNMDAYRGLRAEIGSLRGM